MASGDVKSFFRQRKKNDGIAKSKSQATPSISKAATSESVDSFPSLTLTPDSDVVRSSLISVEPGQDEVELRGFDMNMAYGPCAGMSRVARWERAQRLGLNPPERIRTLLGKPGVCPQSLWDGRV